MKSSHPYSSTLLSLPGDCDMTIDLKELPYLSLRLQIQLDPFGIKLDTSKFESMVREDNSK